MALERAAFVGPLVAYKDVFRQPSEDLEENTAENVFRVCPHQQAVEGWLFLSSDVTAKDFIVKTIGSIHLSGTSRQVMHSVAQEIVAFVKKSKKLSSIFESACLQAFNGMKQQAQNFYFQMLGYSAIFAPRGIETNVAMESLRMKQAKNAYSKLLK